MASHFWHVLRNPPVRTAQHGLPAPVPNVYIWLPFPLYNTASEKIGLVCCGGVEFLTHNRERMVELRGDGGITSEESEAEGMRQKMGNKRCSYLLIWLW